MFKAVILLLAISSTVFFINYKFSEAVRVIAFKEDETKKSAILSFLTMIIVIISWTLYFSLF